MTKLVIRIVVIAALLAVIHCAKPNQPEEPSYFVKTPMSDKLAELTALYLSGEIFAPQELYDRVHGDLEVIRDGYEGQYSVIKENEFARQFSASCCGFLLDSATYYTIKGGAYPAWDSLNEHHALDHFSSADYDEKHGIYMIGMRFHGRRHVKRLIEDYITLPGFIDAYQCAPYYTAFGIIPMYTPHWIGDSIAYVFNNGENPIILFIGTPDTLSLVGIWSSREDSDTPGWVEEARYGLGVFYDWINDEPWK